MSLFAGIWREIFESFHIWHILVLKNVNVSKCCIVLNFLCCNSFSSTCSRTSSTTVITKLCFWFIFESFNFIIRSGRRCLIQFYRKITNLASLTVDKEEINIPHSLRGLKISSAKNSKYFNVGRINRRILKFPLKSCVLGAVNFAKRLRRFFFCSLSRA